MPLKSQVFEVRWAPQGIEGSVSSTIEMVEEEYKAGPASMRTIRRGVSKISRGVGGWASMTLAAEGGSVGA